MQWEEIPATESSQGDRGLGRQVQAVPGAVCELSQHDVLRADESCDTEEACGGRRAPQGTFWRGKRAKGALCVGAATLMVADAPTRLPPSALDRRRQ